MNKPEDDPQIRDLMASQAPFVLRSEAPVSEAALRLWCGVMEDRNPAYLDEAEAIRLGHGGLMAPPVMMHSFTLPTLLHPEGPSPSRQLRARMAELGFSGVAAVNYDQEFHRPIRVGDRLARSVKLDSLSERKVTALGTGYFFTTLHRVTNQDNELIGTMLNRVFYFSKEGAKPRVARASPAETAAAAQLAPLDIPVTATLVAVGAIATLDYELVHHDVQTARNQGMKDIFMNILTSSGLSMRYASEWAGYDAKVKRLAVQLHSPNFPGDMMTMTGTASAERTAGGEATVKVTGSNSTGRHVQATIDLQWPS